jgi:hypothetical protein
MMFERSHFARFLKANLFDLPNALDHFKEYLNWRKT